MSYAAEKLKTTGKKTILLEINTGKEQDKAYNYLPGVWAWTYNTYKYGTHSLGYGNLGFGPLGGASDEYSGIYEVPIALRSVYDNGIELTEHASIASVASNVGWYYDLDTRILYFALTNRTDPVLRTIVVGYTIGASNRATYYNTGDGDVYFEPTLMGLPSISKAKDSLYFQLIAFGGGTINLNNESGDYDQLFENYVFGQPFTAKMIFGDDAYADAYQVNSGYLDTVHLDYERCDIETVDNRKVFDRAFPFYRFDATTYASIADKHIGKVKPLVWGTCYNVPCICTNAKAVATAYTYMAADCTDYVGGIRALTTCYVDGKTKAFFSTSLTTGIFQLQASVCSSGEAAVTVDMQGYASVDNGIQLIEDILSTYGGLAYSAANYDQTAWGIQKTAAYDVGYAVTEEKTVIEAVEELSGTQFGQLLRKDDGKYTFIKYSGSATVATTISNVDFLKDSTPSVDWDGNAFLTSCAVGYRKNWDKGDYAYYSNTAYQTDGYTKYRKYQHKSFDTFLTNATDAAAYSEEAMAYMRDVKPVYSFTTGARYIDLEIGDRAEVQFDRPQTTMAGLVTGEVVELEKDLIDGIVSVKVRSD